MGKILGKNNFLKICRQIHNRGRLGPRGGGSPPARPRSLGIPASEVGVRALG